MTEPRNIDDKGTFAFVKNVSRLFGATTIGQGISLLLAPVVARIYGPEPYGVAAVLIAIAGFLSIAATLRFEQAIVVAKSDSDAKLLFQLCVAMAICFAFFLFAPITGAWVFFDEFVASWLGTNRYLLFLLPVLVLLTSMEKTLKALQTRLQGFNVLAIAIIVTSVLVPISRIVLGEVFSPAALGLLVGTISGITMAVLVLGTGISEFRLALIAPLRRLQISKKVKEFSDFPRYSAPTEMLNNVSVQLPVYLLAVLYAPAVVGFYALAMRLVNMPVQALGNAVRQTYFQKCTAMHGAEKNLVPPLLKTTASLFGIGLIPFGLVFVYGEQIFSLILGSAWTESGRYAASLAPWLFTALLIVPYQVTMTVIRKQQYWYRFQICLLALRVVVFAVAFALQYSAIDTIRLFSVTSTLFNLTMICIAFALISSENRNSQ